MRFVDPISRENSETGYEKAEKSRLSLRNNPFFFGRHRFCGVPGKAGIAQTTDCVLHFSNRRKQIENEVCSYFVRSDACVRDRTIRRTCICVGVCARVWVYVRVWKRMYVYAHMCLSITAGAFSYGARSAVLISLHARILWSLQFQREHLYSHPLAHP